MGLITAEFFRLCVPLQWYETCLLFFPVMMINVTAAALGAIYQSVNDITTGH